MLIKIWDSVMTLEAASMFLAFMKWWRRWAEARKCTLEVVVTESNFFWNFV
jgi:hypothetical protein